MALSSWCDKLVDAYQRTADLKKKRALGDGIVMGLTEKSEPSLATREFTAKVQIVGTLRNGEPAQLITVCSYTHCILGVVNAVIYGKGSAEARNADAILGSKFI